MSSIKYWVWLSAMGELSAKARAAVIARFGDAESAFFSPKGSFAGIDGVSAAEAAALDRRELSRVGEILDDCAAQNIAIITMQDAVYPKRLKNIYAPPAVIYVRGKLPAVDDEAAVAVIGTRSATPYGIKMSERISCEIAKCGGVVISGLTSGVDAAAAYGALRADGKVIGVLGTAHEQQDGELAAEVAHRGALVSEYPPGMRSMRSFFRDRNRISAALSLGVVAIEAPEKSGTLLFVAEALEQGKEIFAVPGNADAAACRGTNGLLKEGAKPVTCGWDVMCEFAPMFPGKVKRSDAAPPQESETPAPEQKKEIDKKKSTGYIDLREKLGSLSETQLKIVSAIDPEPTHVDDIAERTGLGAAAVLTQLTLLTVKGIVRRVPGNRAVLNLESDHTVK